MAKIREKKWILLTLAGVLFLGITLSAFNISLAVTQPVIIMAKKITGAIPASPSDPAWNEASSVDVPLSSQIIAKPRWYNTSVRNVTVRALNNGKEIGILLTWRDQSRSNEFIQHEDYRVAAAIQLSVAPTKLPDKPWFCMGQQDQIANIWHWKSDWEAAVAARDMEDVYEGIVADGYVEEMGGKTYITSGGSAGKEMGPFNSGAYGGNIFSDATLRKSSVEDLNAGGFGTLTTQASQDVMGKGEWRNNVWRVVFTRPLTSKDANDAQLEGDYIPIAFAVWDGGNGERDGQKSVSTYYYLKVE